MDAAGAPGQPSQSTVMMLAASAKHLAFDASHSAAMTGSNATTPRDAIRAGRGIDPAGLTPDDRDRRPSRDRRRDSEVRVAKLPRETSSVRLSRSAHGCAACAFERSRRDKGGQEPSFDVFAAGMRASHKSAVGEEGGDDRPSQDAAVGADTNRGAEPGSHTCGKGAGDVEEGAANGGGGRYAFLQGASVATSVAVNDDRSSHNERAGCSGEFGRDEEEVGGSDVAVGDQAVSPSDLALGAQPDAPLPLPLIIPASRAIDESGSYSRHGSLQASPLGTGSASAHSRDGETASVREEKHRAMERKKTMTWEAFLAQYTVEEGEEGRRNGIGRGLGDGRRSDEISPEERIRPTRARVVVRQPRLVESPDPPCASRYPLEPTPSVLSSRSWMDDNATEQGDEAAGEEVGVSALESGTLLHEGSKPEVPHMLSDLDVAIQSRPSDIDVTRGHSLSPRGVQAVHDVRKTEKMGVNKFNVNPKEGLNYLIDDGFVSDTPESICEFLSTVRGLSKRRLGEYFGRDNPMSQKVLSLFLKRLKFNKLDLDEALRAMVLKFRMPGEAQQIDRIMERFSERYHEENPGTFSCSQTAYILAFSLMMLNTDMYNRNLKESEKMTETQFVNNNRGIDQGRDLPQEELQAMYRRVKGAEIRMDEGDMFESEVITFVAPKKSGWLKKKGKGYVNKWKRHWFVLADAVLYYFLAPQHQDEAPRCIIPLERVNVDPIGATDLTISLIGHSGYVKSVKMMDDGHMEQGHHRSFVFRADTAADRDEWVHALRAEVPGNSLDLSVTGRSISGSMSMSRSLSATPATSSAATPIGTPSESGRRISKFPSLRERKRRTSLEAALGSTMHPPVIRGWANARTQSGEQQTWGRRYIALFRGSSGGPVSKDAIYFFGTAAMCDKMVSQSLHTSHLCVTLSDVSRLQLRQEPAKGGRAIALQTGGTHISGKEVVVVPEEQREFSSWVNLIKACCPDGAQHSIAADGTPVSSSIGDETTFLSNATLEEHAQEAPSPAADEDSVAPSTGLATIPSATGPTGTEEDEVGGSAAGNLVTGAETIIDSNAETHGSSSANGSGKGAKESGGSLDYNRTESNETQPPAGLPAPQELNRVLTTPSTEAEQDKSHLVGVEDTPAPCTPMSAKSSGSAEVVATATPRNIREDSTAGTDVE